MRHLGTTLVAFFIFFGASECFALLDVSALFGIANSNNSITSVSMANLTTSARSSFSFGATVDFRIPETSLGLTFGLLNVTDYYHQSFGILGGNDQDVKVPYWQFPVAAQYWFMHYVNVGFGGYYSFPAGNVTTSGTSSGLPFNSSTDFNSAGFRTDDYGILGEAAVYIPVPFGTLATEVTIRGIYEYGFENTSIVASTTNHTSILMFYGGIGIGF